MTNANRTRPVTHNLLHITVLVDGEAKQLPETYESTDAASRAVAAARADLVVQPRYAAGSWVWTVGGQDVAWATTEQVTTWDELPHTWYCSGAAYFPMTLAREGSEQWALTGGTGYHGKVLCAEYRSGYDLAWFTMESVQVDAVSIAPVTQW